MKLHILVLEDILRFITGKLTSPFFCSAEFSSVEKSLASFVCNSDYLFISCWNLVALRLTVLILMLQSKVLECFFFFLKMKSKTSYWSILFCLRRIGSVRGVS